MVDRVETPLPDSSAWSLLNHKQSVDKDRLYCLMWMFGFGLKVGMPGGGWKTSNGRRRCCSVWTIPISCCGRTKQGLGACAEPPTE